MNIVSFKEAKSRYDMTGCKHLNIIIDEQLSQIECADCGAKLNPIAYLTTLAREEKSYKYQVVELGKALKKVKKELETRTRTKCQHCGKMTNINIKRT